MSCESATLSLLLQRGDVTTIVVLVGLGVGSFLLGALATIALYILRRPSPTSSLMDLKQDTYSHSITKVTPGGVYDGVRLPSRSLSQTFVRHSLKPPMNMFNTKEKSEWNILQPMPFPNRQNSDNPFGSVGQLGYPSQDPAKPERNSIQRAGSDPRIAHSGREKTKYKLSAHELRRMKTFSSPGNDSDSRGNRDAPVMEMQERKRSRRPRLTITHLSETTADPSGSAGTALRKEQESGLTRRYSQRAAVLYQDHANRHLSLPHGGPLRSRTVLPDSPSGVIGDFSLA